MNLPTIGWKSALTFAGFGCLALASYGFIASLDTLSTRGANIEVQSHNAIKNAQKSGAYIVATQYVPDEQRE